MRCGQPVLCYPCDLRQHPNFYAYLALAAVCFFWGTTYLGIRMALESFSPFELVALRFTLSGGLMLAGTALYGARLPRGRALWRTALNGVIILGFGNGCLSVAEQWIPSGLAALFITVSPFWMVGIEALVPGGDRLHGPTVLGMIVGLVGVAFLVSPGGVASGQHLSLVTGFVTLQIGCAGWAFGSIAQRRHTAEAHPFVSGAIQQLATGIVFLLLALLAPHAAIRWSVRGVSALLYLMMFGSIVGYSAYLFALDRLPVAVVAIYNYINPIIAVLLGWLFYREPFGPRESVGMLIIFLGVALVKRYGDGGQPISIQKEFGDTPG